MAKIGKYNNVLPLIRFQPIRTIGKRFPTIELLFTKPRRFTLEERWQFTLNHDGLLIDIVLPEQRTDSDGASFPWWLRAVVPSLIFMLADDKWVIALLLIIFAALGKLVTNAIGIAFTAGIMHDYLYKHHYLPTINGARYLDGCTRWEADRLFIEVHYQVNGIKWLAWLTGLLLYLGSWIPWNNKRLIINRGKNTRFLWLWAYIKG